MDTATVQTNSRADFAGMRWRSRRRDGYQGLPRSGSGQPVLHGPSHRPERVRSLCCQSRMPLAVGTPRPAPHILLAWLMLSACGKDTPPSPTPPSQRPTEALLGSFSMTLNIGATCGVVPEADRTRTYSASVDSSVIDGYIVTLDGATFLNGLICSRGSGRFFGMGCNQFFASEENAIATFRLANNNDEGHGGHIVEQLASGGWLEVIGDASGKLDNFNTIEASGTASVWYCPTPSPYPFPCARFVSCRSDLRITLTRR